MKKITLTILVAILFLSIFNYSQAKAQTLIGDWSSSISCQNQSDVADANVELLFYQEDTGVQTSIGSEVIPAGMSTNFVVTGLPEGSIGSVVVQASQPVTCAIDYSAVTTGTESNPYRFAATKGFDPSEIGPTMYVSQVEKAFYNWNSYIAIQNTTSDPVDVTVSFVDRYGNGYPDVPLTIPGYANHLMYLSEITSLPSNFIGGATISADDGVTPLAVSTAFFNIGSSSSTSQIHAWNGSASGSNLLYAPYIVRNYYGYQSGITIQNIGDSPTSFKITFTFNGQDFTYQFSSELGVGEIKDLYLPNLTELNGVDNFDNRNRYGKAVIEATDVNGNPNSAGELIGNINQDNRGGSGIPEERAGQGATYGAFPSSSGAAQTFIAKWMVHAGGFSSGVHVSNFSNTNVTCDFIFPSDPDANFSTVVSANSFFTKWAPDVTNLNYGYNSGVKIDCTGQVFVITNAAIDPDGGKYGDSFYQMSAGAGVEE